MPKRELSFDTYSAELEAEKILRRKWKKTEPLDKKIKKTIKGGRDTVKRHPVACAVIFVSTFGIALGHQEYFLNDNDVQAYEVTNPYALDESTGLENYLTRPWTVATEEILTTPIVTETTIFESQPSTNVVLP